MGQESIRGIFVNHWRSCYKWPGGNLTYSIDYYFSGNLIHKSPMKVKFRLIFFVLIFYCVCLMKFILFIRFFFLFMYLYFCLFDLIDIASGRSLEYLLKLRQCACPCWGNGTWSGWPHSSRVWFLQLHALTSGWRHVRFRGVKSLIKSFFAFVLIKKVVNNWLKSLFNFLMIYQASTCFYFFTLDPKRGYLPWTDKYRQTSPNSITVLLQSGNHQRNR